MAIRIAHTWKIAGFGVALGLVGLLATGIAVQAQGRSRGFGGPPFGRMGGPGMPGGPLQPGALMRGLRALDITDTQREQVRAVFEQYRPQFEALGTQMREAGRALHDTVTAETFDEVAIRDRSTALAAVQADLAVLGARVRADVFDLLTPEQKQKAAELAAERERRMEERRQRRQERRSSR